MSKDSKIVIPDTKVFDQYIELDFNDFSSFFVGTNTLEESNYYLNSLWRNMNEQLTPDGSERCPWFYIPQKIRIKQLMVTYFGSVRTKIGYFHVAVSYRKKGFINNIHFLPFELSVEEDEVSSVLKGLVKKSKKEIKLRFKYIVSCKIIGEFVGQKKYIKLLDYLTDNFIIIDSKLEFDILAQDITDAEGIASSKLRSIVNFLAVETNVYFEYEDIEVRRKDGDSSLQLTDCISIYQEDLCDYVTGYENDRFIDFYPSVNGDTILSKDGVNFLNKIISSNIDDNKNLSIFLNACYHFREGLKMELSIVSKHVLIGESIYFQAAKNNQFEMQNIIDSTITHYLSSIETVTLIDHVPEKCASCGQLKFQINQRVYEFMNTYLWKTHGDIFKKIYNLRSLYLHTGLSYSKNRDTNTRPLLDDTTGTGSVDLNFISISVKGKAIGFGVENIREWTGYSLRNFYKDFKNI